MIGKIIKNISNSYTILYDDKIIECLPRGLLKKEKIIPLVGDLVEFELEKKLITKVMPRKNELARPKIANIDYALIVTSLKQPDLSLSLLDKQIAYSLINNIKPIICFTKLDLITKEQLNELAHLRKYYKNIKLKLLIIKT